MRHNDKIEIHQHALEKLMSQRKKVQWQLESASLPREILESLKTLNRIIQEEIEVRETLKKLYGEA